jgi:hypothetical protein
MAELGLTRDELLASKLWLEGTIRWQERIIETHKVYGYDTTTTSAKLVAHRALLSEYNRMLKKTQ